MLWGRCRSRDEEPHPSCCRCCCVAHGRSGTAISPEVSTHALGQPLCQTGQTLSCLRLLLGLPVVDDTTTDRLSKTSNFFLKVPFEHGIAPRHTCAYTCIHADASVHAQYMFSHCFHAHVCVLACARACAYAHVCVRMLGCASSCVSVHGCMCARARLHVCIHGCMHACVHKCQRTCVRVHLCTRV